MLTYQCWFSNYGKHSLPMCVCENYTVSPPCPQSRRRKGGGHLQRARHTPGPALGTLSILSNSLIPKSSLSCQYYPSTHTKTANVSCQGLPQRQSLLSTRCGSSCFVPFQTCFGISSLTGEKPEIQRSNLTKGTTVCTWRGWILILKPAHVRWPQCSPSVIWDHLQHQHLGEGGLNAGSQVLPQPPQLGMPAGSGKGPWLWLCVMIPVDGCLSYTYWIPLSGLSLVDTTGYYLCKPSLVTHL